MYKRLNSGMAVRYWRGLLLGCLILSGFRLTDASGAPSNPHQAAVVRLYGIDTTTQGNWSDKYGADGQLIFNGLKSIPAYANLRMSGGGTYTWSTSTSDPRALQSAKGSTARIASTYYAATTVTIDLNLTDHKTHQVALYLCDWEYDSRAENISVVDASTGASLANQSFSEFSNGIYANWLIAGHVKIKITRTAGANAIVNGIFFDTPSLTPSASGTTIPPAPQIVDGGGSIWTVVDGVIYQNGSLAGYSNQVIELLLLNGVIYQENSSLNWWSWNGSGWTAVGNPIPTINGACGTANGMTLSSAPTANLCSAGTASSVSGSGPWSWTCGGNNGGTQASCSAQLAVAPSPTAHKVGMNMTPALDYAVAQPYADVMKMARAFYQFPSCATPLPQAQVDSNFWPTADFSVLLWGNVPHANGTYSITFPGSATIALNWLNGSVTSNHYDVASDSTTAKMVLTDTSPTNFCMNFSNTSRSAGSAPGSGLTGIKIMQPLLPGSTTSYPATALFNTPIASVLSQTQVVRYMDFTSTNSIDNPEDWSNRQLASFSSTPAASNYTIPGYSKGTCSHPSTPYTPCPWSAGQPWEHVILYSNEINRDAWINVPVAASDDYVMKLAQTFAFGSDGILPYTGTFGSAYDAVTNPRPAQHSPSSWASGTTAWYPPMASNLNLYVEYSNELWNFAFTQAGENYALAQAEVAAGNSSLDFKNSPNVGGPYQWAFRRVAEREVQISNIFRSVFGDSNMPGTSANPRIRPVIEAQQDNGQGTLNEIASLMMGFYNNLSGNYVGPTGSFNTLLQWPTAPAGKVITGPHPPSYYLYGGGGSGYYNPDDSDPNLTDALTGDSIWNSSLMNVTNWYPWLNADIDGLRAMGLRRIAYEGGPSFDRIGNPDASGAVKQQAWNDPQMTTAMIQHQQAWEQYGGDLLVYFTATGDYQWGFIEDATELQTPKMAAIANFNSTSPAPPTYGFPAGSTVPGSVPSFGSNNCGVYAGSVRTGPMLLTAGNGSTSCGWVSYSFLASSLSQGIVTVSTTLNHSASPVPSGTVSVYIDGVAIGQQTASDGGTLSFQSTSSVGPGIHGIVVQAASGQFVVSGISLK